MENGLYSRKRLKPSELTPLERATEWYLYASMIDLLSFTTGNDAIDWDLDNEALAKQIIVLKSLTMA